MCRLLRIEIAVERGFTRFPMTDSLIYWVALREQRREPRAKPPTKRATAMQNDSIYTNIRHNLARMLWSLRKLRRTMRVRP